MMISATGRYRPRCVPTLMRFPLACQPDHSPRPEYSTWGTPGRLPLRAARRSLVAQRLDRPEPGGEEAGTDAGEEGEPEGQGGGAEGDAGRQAEVEAEEGRA